MHIFNSTAPGRFYSNLLKITYYLLPTYLPSKNPAKQVPATTYSLCFLKALKWSRIAVMTHSCPANMESKPNVKSMKKNKKDIKGGLIGNRLMA